MAIPSAVGYGSLSEHHAYGETEDKSVDYEEDLAATMLAGTLGIEFDPEKNYDERKEVYRMSGKIVKTRNIVQLYNIVNIFLLSAYKVLLVHER